LPSQSTGLFDQIVAAACKNALDVLHAIELRKCSYGSPITPQLISTDHVWDIRFAKQPGEEGSRRLSIPMPLKENALHETVLIHPPPQTVSDAIHHRADLVQTPPGTPPEFQVAQFFSEQKVKFYAPLAKRFMADLNAVLVKQFLQVTVTEGKQWYSFLGMLDDHHRKTVALGFGVGHERSAYSELVKAIHSF